MSSAPTASPSAESNTPFGGGNMPPPAVFRLDEKGEMPYYE
jgi:hypothetical protein